MRNLVWAGVSEAVAMKLTGHKTRAVFDRYDITSGRDLTEAAAKLAGAGGGEPRTAGATVLRMKRAGGS